MLAPFAEEEVAVLNSAMEHLDAVSTMTLIDTLSVLDSGHTVILGSRKQQLVLAVLLGNANCLVIVETLIVALRDDCPPQTARKDLQVYISTLYRLLGDTSGIGGPVEQ
jgi:DNA-binding SARP family transcriptional activator